MNHIDHARLLPSIDHLPRESNAVELLREDRRLGINGPKLTGDMIRALADRLVDRPPPVFSFSTTLLGKALVQVGYLREWQWGEDASAPVLALRVVVGWDLEALRALARVALDPDPLLHPMLSCNVSFRPFAITSLFVAAPGEMILQRAG